MARPTKIGLDYFPLDVIVDDDILLLEAEHDLIGFSILIKLWQKIYGSGYFIEWKDDNVLLFAKSINTEITIVNDVINTCLRRGIFDKRLNKQYSILTSRGIQKRYFKVCQEARRTGVVANENYFLLNKLEFPSTFIEFIHEESTQSKVNKKKEEEITPIVKHRFDEDGNEYQLAFYLCCKIKASNENYKEPNLQTWAGHIDKMIRLDKRSIDNIKSVIDWCQQDSFWSTNILSTKKLREKYDQLFMKMNQKKTSRELSNEDKIKQSLQSTAIQDFLNGDKHG